MSPQESVPLVGVDTGGTFTDFVLYEGGGLQHCKVLSTPDDPSRAIAEGLRRLGLVERPVVLIHGTTVATNAVLEGKGARVAYVTSRGFADVLTLGRQERQAVYRLEQPAEAPPVPEELCFEVSTRIDAEGDLLERAGDDELARLRDALEAAGVDAVAVNLIYSFLRPEEERRIADALGEGWYRSLSSEVLPELREYERGVATWLNATVGPVIRRYLGRLAERLPRASISVMQSAGTTVAASEAAAHAVRLLLSGPAGGVAAADMIGRVTGSRHMLTLDMGGTSTDVALIDGGIPLTTESRIGCWPLTLPTVDIHTIGAGGGSIARVDQGGMLLVGPESAGADPGPACYGRGGESITVTDANLVLGRIPAGARLGGDLQLDRDAALRAVERLADDMGCAPLDAARGVIRVANEHMARALRVISVERGHDPRGYELLSFGGAGGLHACELAELLGMTRVLLPQRAGVLSAEGMLASEPGRDLVSAVLAPMSALGDAEIEERFGALERDAAAQLTAEGQDAAALRFVRRMELRYHGQSAGIMIAFEPGADHAAAFHEAHQAASGHRLDHVVELVNLRLSARAPAPLAALPKAGAAAADGSERIHMPELGREVPVLDRAAVPKGGLVGPAVITDEVGTAWLAPGWRAAADEWGNVRFTRE